MTNTELIYKALKYPIINDLEITDTECFVCGREIKEGVKVKKILSGNFTNFDVCKSIRSTHCCKECAYCLKDANLRKNNIVADEENIFLLKKNDLEEYLFNLGKYVKGDFIVCITNSFKKHNSFRAKVNQDATKFYIRQEDKEFIFDVGKMKPIYEKLNEAYLHFSKEELESGNYKMISIEQFGIDKFVEYEELFKQYRKSNQFELLIYIMNSEKRNEYIQAKLKLEKEEKARLKAIEKEEKSRIKALEKEQKKNSKKKTMKNENKVNQISLL